MDAFFLLPVRLLVAAFVVSILGYLSAMPLMPVRLALAPELLEENRSEENVPSSLKRIDDIGCTNAVPFFAGLLGIATTTGLIFAYKLNASANAIGNFKCLGRVSIHPKQRFGVMEFFNSTVTADFTDNPITDAKLLVVASIHKLTCLRLPNARIGSDGCKRISKCRELIRLDLSGTDIEENCLASLSNCRS